VHLGLTVLGRVSSHFSWATMGRGHCHSPPDRWGGVKGGLPSHQTADRVGERPQEGGQGPSQGPSLAAAVLARELGKGAGVVTDMEKGAASGKGLENKREKGETPPNTQGLKPPKAQGWWESSTGGPPEGQGSGRALGEGRGARGRPPALAHQRCRQAASQLPSLSLGCSSAGPPGRYWLQAST